MIVDRTSEDVRQSKLIINTKIKKFIALSESELETLERGTMTINTLNRIENKQTELKVMLNSMGYWDTPTQNKEWSLSHIFDVADFQRIINNTDILRNGFYTFASTPKTPLPKYHFSNINDLEKILYDLEIMIEDVKSHYRECGNFECGG